MGLSAHSFSARFWSLIGATFLGFLGIGAVLPGLAPHIRHDLGGSDQTVGYVIGIFSFVALLSRFFSGPLADRRGRKITFLAGLMSCALAGGAYLLPLGILGAYLGRILQGFGEACLYTGAAAWVVEAGGLERSAQSLGYLSSGIWGGISAGPVVGQWLGSFQHAAAFQMTGALVAFGVLLMIPEHYEPEPHDPNRAWLPRALIAPGLAVGLVNVHYPVITGFLILHLAKHGNSGPAAFTAYALLILCCRFFLGGLPDRIRPSITFQGGLAAMAIALSALALAPPPVVAIGAAALLGFGFSFPWSSIAATVIRRAAPGERGSCVGILSAFYDLFVGVSSFSAGWISSRFGYPAAFFMAVGALGVAAVMGHLVLSNQRSMDEAQLLTDSAVLVAEPDTYC